MQTPMISCASLRMPHVTGVCALALLLWAAAPACGVDSSPEALTSADAALKGGVPANEHGKGRPGGVAGAGAEEEKPGKGKPDAQDADAGDAEDGDCASETHGKSAGRKADDSMTGRDTAAGAAAEHGMSDKIGGKSNTAQGKCGRMKDDHAAKGGAKAAGADKSKAQAGAAEDGDDQNDETDEQS